MMHGQQNVKQISLKCQYIQSEPFAFRRPLQWFKAAIVRVDKVFSCALTAVASGTLQLTQGIIVKFNYSE